MNQSAYNGPWPWKNFSAAEVACKHCGELWEGQAPMPEHFCRSMDALQALRGLWGKSIVLTSAHRCTAHNKAVGGVESSQHRKIAFDCACPAQDQDAFVLAARSAGFTGIGRYPSQGFVHLDLGRAREW